MTVEIFQPSDLNRRGRAILDAARRSRARIRDKDGLSLLVLPEERVELLETFTRFAENLLSLEREISSAAATQKEALDLTDHDWAWLRVFDVEDLSEFLSEMRQVLLLAIHEDRGGLPEEVLHRWRVTAQSLDDPLCRSILLGPFQPADFVEVSRPETPSGEVGD